MISYSQIKNSFPVYLNMSPFELNQSLIRVMGSISDSFKANKNNSIFRSHTKILMDYKDNKNLWAIIRAGNRLNMSSIKTSKLRLVQRAAMTYMFRGFSLLCWAHTLMYTPNSLKRMLKCQPVGFGNSGFYPCKHIMCPNCYMRKAAAYSKTLAGLNPVNPAIIIKVETPFDEHIHGYIPVPIRNTSRIRTLRKRMVLGENDNLFMTSGVALTNRHPSITVNFHVISDPQDFDRNMENAKDFADAIEKFERENSTKVKIVKVDKTAYLPSKMYEDCPIKLIGTSEIGFDDLRLQFTVNEYCDALYNKRINKYL